MCGERVTTDACKNGVNALGKRLEDRIAEAVEEVEVISQSPDHAVVARAAIERVVVGKSNERVVRRIPGEAVGEGVSCDAVGKRVSRS